jgi:hypothetical protein
LQQNVDVIKAEMDVDVPREKDSISVETGDVYIPTALFVKECKPEVSHVFCLLLWWLIFCVCVCVRVHVRVHGLIKRNCHVPFSFTYILMEALDRTQWRTCLGRGY